MMKKILLAAIIMLFGLISVSFAQNPPPPKPTTAPKPRPTPKAEMPGDNIVKGRSAGDDIGTVKGKSDADFKKDGAVNIDAEANSKLQPKILGEWKTSEVIYDGKQVKIEGIFVTESLKFNDDGKFEMRTADGKEFTGTYEVDTTKDPKWITIKYDDDTEQPFAGSFFRGLFDIKEGKLKLVTNVQRRPIKLSAESTSLNTLMEFERIEEEKP